VYNILATDVTMQTYIPAGGWYAFQSVDTPPTDQFGIIKWDEEQPGVVRTRGIQRVTLWVYDVAGDYTRIDQAILRAKTLLTSAVHVAGADGRTLTQADWRGDSQDLFDDAWERIVRTSSFDIVSRPSP